MNAQAGIPQLVRELRGRTGLTQEKFAAKLGVTFPTINRWENGRARPSPLAMKQIEDLLRSMGDRGADLLKRYLETNIMGGSLNQTERPKNRSKHYPTLSKKIVAIGMMKKSELKAIATKGEDSRLQYPKPHPGILCSKGNVALPGAGIRH